MRSPKSRSRSKGNRSRSMGNIVNRVFDSSGPEGKVRGTPQQIIEKYNQLARDAQLSNDRVAAENFQQHAEHYTRMLGEAQREMEARREQQQQQNQQNNNQNNNQQHQPNGRDEQPQAGGQQPDPQQQPQPDASQAPQPDIVEPAGGGVLGFDDGGDSGLVETPESKPEPAPEAEAAAEQPKPKRRAPRTRAKAGAAKKGNGASDGGETPATDGGAETAESA